MKLALVDINQSGVKDSIELNDTIFDVPYNQSLIHQILEAFRAAGRSGSSKQKNRSEVSGGGKKPWRQKGTGNARAGSTRSPIWRKGGVTFASRPRDYTQKVNRKMYRGAIRSICSELLRQQRLMVCEPINLEKPKTKELYQRLVANGFSKTLIVADEVNEPLYYSARNIPNVDVVDVAHLSPVTLVGAEKTLFTVTAIKALEAQLS